MNSREKLKRQITVILHGLVRDRHGAAKAIAAQLDQYAIGRWVSVDERLPEESGPYMVLWSTKRESNPHDVWFDAEAYRDFGGWACVNRYSTITHWLELDLPNEKGE